MASVNDLRGCWRLISQHGETQGTNEREYVFGERPFGRLVLTPDGHMIALLVAKDRKEGKSDSDQAALFRSMLAYTGTYRVEGDRIIVKVDASWNEAWTETDQVRFYKLDGDRLDIVSAWLPHPFIADSPPVRGVLSWRRES